MMPREAFGPVAGGSAAAAADRELPISLCTSRDLGTSTSSCQPDQPASYASGHVTAIECAMSSRSRGVVPCSISRCLCTRLLLGALLLLAVLAPEAHAAWSGELSTLQGRDQRIGLRGELQLLERPASRGRSLVDMQSSSSSIRPEVTAAHGNQSGPARSGSANVLYEVESDPKALVSCINGNQPKHKGTTWRSGMQDIPPYLRVGHRAGCCSLESWARARR